MVEERARREPRRLEELAILKLIHMLIERFIPHILRSYQDIDSVGGFDAIRKEALAIRDWIYEPLNCFVASDVQQLIMEALPHKAERCNRPGLKYVDLLVLHPKCRSLESTYFVNDMIGDVIDMLKSLICLECIEWMSPLGRKETDQFTTNLKYCTGLKIFVHQQGCNDEIIKVLSQNCPLLSALIVPGSKRVTDKSTRYIKNMKSLENCGIIGTSITMEGAISILKNCTQLRELGMAYDTCQILDSLEDAGNPIQLSLTRVELNGYRDTPRLLKKYCPYLTYVNIDGECISKPPCHVTSVKRITISPPCLYSALNIWLIFENINAVALVTDEIFVRDLVELSNVCQNITELYVAVDKVKRNMRNFSEHRPFQKLKLLTFEMGETPERCIKMDASVLKILLSYSTMITHVTIDNLHINDRIVRTIFKTNKMRYLQYWQMKEIACTAKTFYLLFYRCPMLKWIGNLRTWEILPDEAQEIENVIRQGNYNLDTDMSDPDALLIRHMHKARNLLSKVALRMM